MNGVPTLARRTYFDEVANRANVQHLVATLTLTRRGPDAYYGSITLGDSAWADVPHTKVHARTHR